MRELGPVVRLPEHGNFASNTSCDGARSTAQSGLLVSGRGVAACEFANEITLGNSAASDGDRHRAIREPASAAMPVPEALEAIRGRIEEAAAELVDELIAAGEFDAILPISPRICH